MGGPDLRLPLQGRADITVPAWPSEGSSFPCAAGFPPS